MAPKISSGFVAWEGPSRFDGEPIGVIINHVWKKPTRLKLAKLGPMAEAWVLPRDHAPIEFHRTGRDVSVCGNCPQRHHLGGACYVQPFNESHRVWHTWRNFGTYGPFDDNARAALAGKRLRIAGFGDPVMVPSAVWDDLRSIVPGWTAYTHQWRNADPREYGWCMASVDTPEEYAEATALGWRCYRTRLETDPLLPGEIVCPAAPESPRAKLDCSRCRLCNGIRTGNGNAPNATIIAHGTQQAKYVKRRHDEAQPGLPLASK